MLKIHHEHRVVVGKAASFLKPNSTSFFEIIDQNLGFIVRLVHNLRQLAKQRGEVNLFILSEVRIN